MKGSSYDILCDLAEKGTADDFISQYNKSPFEDKSDKHHYIYTCAALLQNHENAIKIIRFLVFEKNVNLSTISPLENNTILHQLLTCMVSMNKNARTITARLKENTIDINDFKDYAGLLKYLVANDRRNDILKKPVPADGTLEETQSPITFCSALVAQETAHHSDKTIQKNLKIELPGILFTFLVESYCENGDLQPLTSQIHDSHTKRLLRLLDEQKQADCGKQRRCVVF